MADPDLVRCLVSLLAADVPSQAINHELTVAGYDENEILDEWVEVRLAGFPGRCRGPRSQASWDDESPVQQGLQH